MKLLSSSSLFLLSWLVILSLVEQAFCLPLIYRECPPSSCGNLQIEPPFYLKSQKSGCATHSQYQLNCEGNRATLQIFEPENYIVTEINWNSINVVSARFVDGSCTVPTVSLSPSVLKDANYLSFYLGSLVKCRELISNNSMYLPVGCMSTNDSFVYLVEGHGAYQVRYLEPSCFYLASIPLGFDLSGNTTGDVFKLLQEEFTIYFPRSLFWSSWIEIIGVKVAQIVGILLAKMITVRFILLPPTMLVFLAYLLFKSKNSIDEVEKFLQNQQSLMPTRYAYTDIIRITGNFRQKLGQGGFGSVFKGVLPGGILVAVKMLSSSSCNGDEFINEVATLGTIHHFNVVRLVGFCAEGSKRALIYEYMLNGSLDKYIFTNGNKSCSHTFTLAKLNEIAMGIARGIEYLHRGCNMQILHFDIKPNNILLDVNFNPKISDFGLAKLYPRERSLVTISAARGTIGYMAPELVSRSFGAISHKSDVYSFGMLLMEMVGGRRNADPHIDRSSRVYYPSWIYDKLVEQQHYHSNENLDITEVEKKLSLVALWCIQINSSDRPDISRVIEMLESDIDSLRIPMRPFFASDSLADVAEIEIDCSTDSEQYPSGPRST